MERSRIREADFHILLNILLKHIEFLPQACIFIIQKVGGRVVEGVKED